LNATSTPHSDAYDLLFGMTVTGRPQGLATEAANLNLPVTVNVDSTRLATVQYRDRQPGTAASRARELAVIMILTQAITGMSRPIGPGFLENLPHLIDSEEFGSLPIQVSSCAE
jgi:hypothetical protein